MKNALFTLAFGLTALSMSATDWTDVANASQLSNAIANEAEGIRITADFSSAGGHRIFSSTEIDLNGHKIDFTGQAFAVLNYADVTFDDLSEAANGEMTCENHSLIFINTLGAMKIKGGTYTTNGRANCIEVAKYRELLIEGGRINASRHGKAIFNQGYVKMFGGTIVGADRGLEPVSNDGEAVFTMLGGAVYAGNMTSSVCFENSYWTDGEDEEEATTILPEGIVDGGAIVLDEKWAIPNSYYINYHLPEQTEIQPNLTHYYFEDQSFALPECNYRNYIAFAGWSASPDDDSNLLTEIKEGSTENYQLYPVWKYLNISPDVSPNMIPESVSPSPDETVNELSEITLYFGEGDYYVADDASDLGGVYNLMTGNKVSDVASIDTDWDGNAYIHLSDKVTANGSYELRIPVNTIGNDEWYYSDMEEGRCNPDLIIRYKVYNAPEGETACETDPENGATVKELSVIRFVFPDEEDVYKNYDAIALFTNQNGEIIAEISAMDFDYDSDADNAIVLTLPEPITTTGTYTLSIPVGFFQFDWGDRDCTGLTFTWTVDAYSSINAINTDSNVSDVIYDLTGRNIQNTDKNHLQKGIYIINGQKTVIK